jgi:dihydropteroate synthase
MTVQIYLRPRALLYSEDASEAIASRSAGALAGGSIGFCQVELIERDGAAIGQREVMDYAAANQSAEATIRSALHSITAPRAGIHGLDLPDVAVMGVVNVTPDSFSDGGSFADEERAVVQGRALVSDGADILDIGGESTRPGADATPLAEELARVLPVIERLMPLGVPISIDTRKADVMRQAAGAGAAIVNDVTALRHDPGGLDAVRDLGLPVVLMHSAGDPKIMQDNPTYDHVVLDVYDALRDRIAACEAAGIERTQIIVDPGIGFGKTFQHNHELLRALTIFHGLGVRIMLGVSRKAFIGRLSGEKVAGKRVSGSVAAALMGVMQGVQLVRVHDVRETVQGLRTWLGILSGA